VKRTLVCALFCLLASCKRDAPSADPASVAPSAAAPQPSVPAKEKPASAWYAGTWTGTYDAALNKLEPAPGALREWAKDEGQASTGKGTLKLTVDAGGVATGEADGVLGPQIVTGNADAETLRLSLAPKQMDDLKGFRGTVVVKRNPEVLQGMLRAGSGDGTTLRQASLELRRATP
jgi:hypothetical protein